jgi:hypothetical protein
MSVKNATMNEVMPTAFLTVNTTPASSYSGTEVYTRSQLKQ